MLSSLACTPLVGTVLQRRMEVQGKDQRVKLKDLPRGIITGSEKHSSTSDLSPPLPPLAAFPSITLHLPPPCQTGISITPSSFKPQMTFMTHQFHSEMGKLHFHHRNAPQGSNQSLG